MSFLNELFNFMRRMVAMPISQGCANPAGCSYPKNAALELLHLPA